MFIVSRILTLNWNRMFDFMNQFVLQNYIENNSIRFVNEYFTTHLILVFPYMPYLVKYLFIFLGLKPLF